MERCSNKILEQRSKSVNTALPALDGVISLVTHNRAMHVAALAAGTARFLVDSDPGRLRLRSAAATTLSLVIAIVAMLAFTRVAHQPVTVAMLGTIVAMQSSAAVKDRQQHSRVVTMLLLFFPALGAVVLAALLSPFGWVADVGFIAVLFTAVWVRRFGPRGNALGMVAFISYFFALFLRASPAQIPVLAVAVAVGLSASLFVRTLIFPDRPRAEVRHLLRALRGASSSVLEAATHRDEYDLAAVRRRLEPARRNSADDRRLARQVRRSAIAQHHQRGSGVAGLRCSDRHGASGEHALGARPGRRTAERTRGCDRMPCEYVCSTTHPRTNCGLPARVPPQRQAAPTCRSPRVSRLWSHTAPSRRTSPFTTSPRTRWEPATPRYPSRRHHPTRSSRG